MCNFLGCPEARSDRRQFVLGNCLVSTAKLDLLSIAVLSLLDPTQIARRVWLRRPVRLRRRPACWRSRTGGLGGSSRPKLVFLLTRLSLPKVCMLNSAGSAARSAGTAQLGGPNPAGTAVGTLPARRSEVRTLPARRSEPCRHGGPKCGRCPARQLEHCRHGRLKCEPCRRGGSNSADSEVRTPLAQLSEVLTLPSWRSELIGPAVRSVNSGGPPARTLPAWRPSPPGDRSAAELQPKPGLRRGQAGVACTAARTVISAMCGTATLKTRSTPGAQDEGQLPSATSNVQVLTQVAEPGPTNNPSTT